MSDVPAWQTKIIEKQAIIAGSINKEWTLPTDVVEICSRTSSANAALRSDEFRNSGFLSPKELEITERYDSVELIKLLADSTLTAEEVTLAFCKRSAAARQLTFCVTEPMYAAAIERAKFLDDYLAKEKRTLGPLHGLPISIKDSFNVKGVHATIGFASFLDNPPATTNSPLIDILLDQGAVLHAKTNIPQTLMTADSDNNIFGRTLNPYNTSMTAGGSSGGEGAHVALRASLLGVGTDVAGSIRIPALCCGVYGFKPSSDRIPYGGQTSPGRPGLPAIIAAAGPLATSMAGVVQFVEAVMESKPWRYDSTAHAYPWRKLDAVDQLTIGILPEDPAFPLHPPVRRTVEAAATKLAAAGHKIVRIPYELPSSATQAMLLASKYYTLDAKNTAISHILKSGEPVIPSIIAISQASKVERVDMADLPELNVLRTNYQRAWHAVFQSQGIDVVLGPAAQHTAVPHDTYIGGSYTAMWNLLDYPGCVIPFGHVSRDEDLPAMLKDPNCAGYNPEGQVGLPCVVQVNALRFHDEECIRASVIIDKVLNG